jgi:histidinol dehydrogenase
VPEWRREYCETVLSGFGDIVIAREMDQGLEFVNQYAPEHLEGRNNIQRQGVLGDQYGF